MVIFSLYLDDGRHESLSIRTLRYHIVRIQLLEFSEVHRCSVLQKDSFTSTLSFLHRLATFSNQLEPLSAKEASNLLQRESTGAAVSVPGTPGSGIAG